MFTDYVVLKKEVGLKMKKTKKESDKKMGTDIPIVIGNLFGIIIFTLICLTIILGFSLLIKTIIMALL
ncbi:MAG: hypothetical protein PWP52_2347 [Bacteroidales bacterium]|nr:hypothetical protein [Bacteroidales bacterium]